MPKIQPVVSDDCVKCEKCGAIVKKVCVFVLPVVIRWK